MSAQPFASPILRRLDAISEWTGRGIAWLTLAMVLVTFTIVVLRYVFNLGWIALQESVTYLHAYVFMLGAAYTLRHNGHVRVDIFYRAMAPHKKALVDMLGTLVLLIPFCVFIFTNSWDAVIGSWQLMEGSEQTGGLDLVYLLKSAMLVMPVLLLLQAVAEFLRQYLVFRGQRPPRTEPPQQEM